MRNYSGPWVVWSWCRQKNCRPVPIIADWYVSAQCGSCVYSTYARDCDFTKLLGISDSESRPHELGGETSRRFKPASRRGVGRRGARRPVILTIPALNLPSRPPLQSSKSGTTLSTTHTSHSVRSRRCGDLSRVDVVLHVAAQTPTPPWHHTWHYPSFAVYINQHS